jgi:hypothetical protein
MKHGGVKFVMNLKTTKLFDGLLLYPKIFDPILGVFPDYVGKTLTYCWSNSLVLKNYRSLHLKHQQSYMKSWVSYQVAIAISMHQKAASQHNNTVYAGHFLSFVKSLTDPARYEKRTQLN